MVTLCYLSHLKPSCIPSVWTRVALRISVPFCTHPTKIFFHKGNTGRSSFSVSPLSSNAAKCYFQSKPCGFASSQKKPSKHWHYIQWWFYMSCVFFFDIFRGDMCIHVPQFPISRCNVCSCHRIGDMVIRYWRIRVWTCSIYHTIHGTSNLETGWESMINHEIRWFPLNLKPWQLLRNHSRTQVDFGNRISNACCAQPTKIKWACSVS